MGYKWGEDKKLHIDEATAAIPKIIFEMYAEGKGKKAIADYLNSKGYRTRTGKPFQANSLNCTLKNKKYTGVYVYGEIEIENGCPALIDRKLFERVQALLEQTKKAPARARAKVEYLLAGKIFCGYCGEKMIATGGTSQSGEQYHYYKCKNKNCCKKAERKDFIEWFIAEQLLELLNMSEHKERLAEKVIYAYTSSMEVDKISEIEKQIKSVETRLNNVVDMLIERKTDALLQKMDDLELQKSELQEQLYSAKLTAAHIPSKKEIIDWFERLQTAFDENMNVAKQVLATFVKSVYLWDDKAVIELTLSNTTKTVTFEQIREFEMLSNDGSCNSSSGSPYWT